MLLGHYPVCPHPLESFPGLFLSTILLASLPGNRAWFWPFWNKIELSIPHSLGGLNPWEVESASPKVPKAPTFPSFFPPTPSCYPLCTIAGRTPQDTNYSVKRRWLQKNAKTIFSVKPRGIRITSRTTLSLNALGEKINSPIKDHRTIISICFCSYKGHVSEEVNLVLTWSNFAVD